MEDAEGWLRSVAAPGDFTGHASALRMARHEAIVVRGWDALDPRVRWEPRDFAGPLDEAAYLAGLAAAGLRAGWHDSLYPSAAQAEGARRDAAQACGLAGVAIGNLDRVRGALARFLGLPSPPQPGYPEGELAEAALRLTRAGDSIRARIPVQPAPGETPAVAAARRFRDACSGLAAVLDSHSAEPADAGEALGKIGAIAEPAKDYASSVRHNLRELAPTTRPGELATWRDWDPTAGSELAAAWAALNAWKQAVRSAAKARAGRGAAGTQSATGQLPAGQAGFPVASPLAPPGPGAAAGQRTPAGRQPRGPSSRPRRAC
jgi:hypothetical protein